MTRKLLALGAVLAGALALVLHDAAAQRVDPRRPATFVVGRPPGAAPMQRIDARRSGVSKTLLPSGTLRIAWRKTTSLTIDQPALSGADGTLAVVSARGDVTFLDEGGDEKAIVKVGAAQVGPAAMTSDGTVVFMASGGDVIGVRRSSAQARFSTRIGGERNVRAAPLSLDDGGVVIATMTDLVVLDAEGNVRARAVLPESPAAPLLAAGDKVLAVTSTGAVFGWTPGREAVRLGSFGAPIDGGAVLVDGTLIAVIEGNHLAEVDLAHGGRSTRSIAPQGLYLGPPSVRSAAGGAVSTLLSLTQSREFVVSVDAAGQEVLRAPVASFSPPVLPDGGVPPLIPLPHAAPLVDARGTVAFATTDGQVGVVGADGVVDTIGEQLCAKGIRAGVAGLTPFGAGAFAVTCDAGIIVRITGPGGDARPAAPATSAPSTRLRPSRGEPPTSTEDGGWRKARKVPIVPAMITMTDRAAEKVREIAVAEDLSSQGLRLRVVGGGCAGFTYDLYFEDATTEMDEEFESKGVKLYVDPLSFQYLTDTEIDYVEGVHGSGFKFNNPNVTGSCGCGSSVKF